MSLSRSTLLGICTVAVAAIYSAGYVYTEPSAQANSLNPPSARSSSTSSVKGQTASRPLRYRDGIYTASGANPYGTLSVEVRIASGKIAGVRITSYTMHYPQAFIDPVMPKQVLQRQTWRVYIVTGATASSYNFAEAVYRALAKAKV